MPEKKTKEKAGQKKKEGKSSSTQAGEYVREEMHHRKQGKQSKK